MKRESKPIQSDASTSDNRLSRITVNSCGGRVFFLQKQMWGITIYMSVLHKFKERFQLARLDQDIIQDIDRHV